MEKNFCSEMKKNRTRLGFSFTNLAQQMKVLGFEVSAPTLQRYESGVVKNVPYEAVEALAKIFGVTPTSLVGWEENPGWYDPEAAEIAQAMKDNPGMRVLLDASKHVSLETLKALAATIKTLAKKPDEEDYSQDPDDYPKK